jgi:mRNA interferase HigB
MRGYPDAREPLQDWYDIAKRARWRSIAEVRRLFPHADAATVKSGGIVTIFNVRGNRYRLIVAIHYNRQQVFMLRFLTHAEYNKNRWIEQL